MVLRLTLLATLAVLVAMWGWSIPAIEAAGSGGLLFDARVFGYDREAAAALLEALGTRGRALYLGRQQALDTAFPALLALSLILLARRWLAPGPALALAGLAVVYAVLDYGENALVARLLRAGTALPDPGLVAMASRLTMAKYAALTLTLAGLAAARFPRSRRGTGGPRPYG